MDEISEGRVLGRGYVGVGVARREVGSYIGAARPEASPYLLSATLGAVGGRWSTSLAVPVPTFMATSNFTGRRRSS